MGSHLMLATFLIPFLFGTDESRLNARGKFSSLDKYGEVANKGGRQRIESPLKTSDWAAIVREFTIGIGTPSGTGSGVVIGRKGKIYTALTARHVMPSFNKKDEYEVYSPTTGKFYKVSGALYPDKKDIDIMIVQFESADNISIAVINEFYKDPTLVQPNSVARSWKVGVDGVRGGGISMPTKAVTVPIFRYTESALLERAVGNLNGYELLYEASTVPGMSGGPLVGWRALECAGSSYSPQGYFSLIAIHGRSEGYDQGGGRSGISLGVPVDLISGFLRKHAVSLGIPTSASASKELALSNYC